MKRRDPRLPEAARRSDRTTVLALLRQSADPNVASGDGTTALHWAAYHDDEALVEALLRAGADPHVRARVDAQTPLGLAATASSVRVIQALLWYGADPNAATTNGLTPLMSAAGGGNNAAVEALLRAGADPQRTETIHGQTALHFAADRNRAGAIRLLARHGARLDATSRVTRLRAQRFDDDGNPIGGAQRTAPEPESTPPSTPARGAASRRAAAVTLGGNTALTLAARNGHREAARALLDVGAPIHQGAAGDRTTPLVSAICNGHYDLAAFLLTRRANPNQASVDGLAALYATIDTQWAPVGWAPNPITDQEKTNHLELMRRLLASGADPNARLIKKLWFRPTHHDEYWIGTAGATPFWRAAMAWDLAAMKLLVAHGADPKIPNADGDNALMAAAGLGWNGNFSVQGPDTALETVRYCLELGLDPTLEDEQGYTALAGAAYRGDNALIELLIARGARLDVRTDRGWSVTDMANGPSLRSSVPVKHPETVALLLQRGAPPLTSIDNEEILGIIRTRPNAPEAPR